MSDAQRKLETQNSKLEDRLLKIVIKMYFILNFQVLTILSNIFFEFKVEKYESEQKDLFEELRIAHSKLVELKLTISNLEEEKVHNLLDF